MKSCVLVVNSRSGTGVQTVTGVIDRDGNTFTGKLAFFLNTNNAVNTLSFQTGANITASVFNQGADDGTNGCGGSFGDIDQFFAKIVSTGDLRRYSLGDYQPDIFFGGNWQGYGFISAFRDGEFDITFALNNRGGWAFMVVVLGGDDLIVDAGGNLLSGSYATTGTPVGVLVMTAAYSFSSSPAATTGAGGRQMPWGWDTKIGGRGTGMALMISQGGNARGALTDRMFALISGSSFTGAPTVSAWGDASYTIANGISTGATRFAFSGVSAYATTVDLRATTGQQQVDLQIAAKWIKIVTVGIPASSSPDTTEAQISVGWTDGTRQGCAWIRETQSTNPITGKRYLSNNSIARGMTGPGGQTTFTLVVEVTSVDIVTGTLTLNVSQTDGQAYQLLIFALGDALPPATNARLTQLPLEIAYDYAILRPFISSGGAAWVTPPRVCSDDE